MKRNILILSATLVAASVFMFGFRNVNDAKSHKIILMEAEIAQIKITRGDVNIEIHKFKPADIIKESRNYLEKLETEGYELVTTSIGASATSPNETLYVLREK